jgi:hypothetical protein
MFISGAPLRVPGNNMEMKGGINARGSAIIEFSSSMRSVAKSISD